MSYKRLTGWDNDSAYVRECFERNGAEGGCDDMDSLKCNRCEANIQVIRRLAQYEDSGLSPEEVTRLAKAKAEGRLLILPVPIGGTIYVPYKYKDTDGTIEADTEEAKLSGYVKGGDREFYTTYDEMGTNDYDPRDIFLTREEAEKALEGMVPEEDENPFDSGQKCRVCGYTWFNACEGGCYWVEDDLCSACAVRANEDSGQSVKSEAEWYEKYIT